MRRAKIGWAAAIGLLVGTWVGGAWGNAGPFILKYPGGDPASKGVLARLDPSLMPARETRLRVLREDLSFRFEAPLTDRTPPKQPLAREDPFGPSRVRAKKGRKKEPPASEDPFGPLAGELAGKDPFGPEPNEPSRKPTAPLVAVSATYAIENPTGTQLQVDFGFPILRGIHLDSNGKPSEPSFWAEADNVLVLVDNKPVPTTILSTSMIWDTIRWRAHEVILKGIAADAKLAALVQEVQFTSPPALYEGYAEARAALRAYLVGPLKWNQRDAALLIEFPRLDYSQLLNAIGDQKFTQFYTQLASRFDKGAATNYEATFAAWGGDVRERAVDLRTGKIRPREVELSADKPGSGIGGAKSREVADPTVYARVDYLDSNAMLSDADRTLLRAVLKNLPVVFTFAPMELLHYQVTFPPKATRAVTVKYFQYACVDTCDPATYQLAYVLHPATLWDEFGPIYLSIHVPKGVTCRAGHAAGQRRFYAGRSAASTGGNRRGAED